MRPLECHTSHANAEAVHAAITGHAIRRARHAAEADIACVTWIIAGAEAVHAVITALTVGGAGLTAEAVDADVARLAIIAVLAYVARHLTGSTETVLTIITGVLATNAALALLTYHPPLISDVEGRAAPLSEVNRHL